MLLSDEKVAEKLRSDFICVWNEVRSVPKISMDFGDGEVIDRTLVGNTALLIVEPSGKIHDAWTGVVLPEDWLPQLDWSLKSYGKSDERERILRDELELAQQDLIFTTMSKMVVEVPLVKSLGRDVKKRELPLQVKDHDDLPDGPRAKMKRMYADQVQKIHDTSKSALVLPGQPDLTKLSARQILEMDSRANSQEVRSLVRMLLLSEDEWNVERFSEKLYLEVMQVPVNDPYLGLVSRPIPGTPVGGGNR